MKLVIDRVRPKEFIWIKSWGLTPLQKINFSGLSPGRLGRKEGL